MVQSIRQNMQEDSITEPKKRKNDLKQIVTLRKDVCLPLNCDYFKTKNIRGDFSPPSYYHHVHLPVTGLSVARP